MKNKDNRLERAIANKEPYAFLSSLIYENEDRSNPVLREVRKNIYQNNYLPDHELLPIYVDECYHNLDHKENQNQDRYESVDRLFTRIRECELVIFLLVNTDRKINTGSPILEAISPASFWEIEFFQALANRKKIVIIAEEHFALDKQLKSVYYLFRNLLGAEIPCYPKQEFPDVVKEILKTGNSIITPCVLNLSQYLLEVDRQRYRPVNQKKNFVEPALLSPFLDDHPFENIKIVEDELEKYQSIPNFEQKLSRLYVIYRAMLSVNYNLEKNERYLGVWNKFLNQWFETVNWYGLQGRIFSFSIPIANDAVMVRDRMNEVQVKNKQPLAPTGLIQLARATYSTYKLSTNKQDLNRVLGITGTDPNDNTYCYVRGHVYMEQGNYEAAINDFKLWQKMVDSDIRTMKQLSGQELTNHKSGSDSVLGLAYFASGKKKQGLKMMRKAAENMSDVPEKIRVLKRLSCALKAEGDAESETLAEQAKKLAIHLGAWGQLTQLLNSE